MSWFADFADWVEAHISRWTVGFSVSDDDAAELGFKPDEFRNASRHIAAMGAPADLLPVAMDAARYYNLPLQASVEMVLGVHFRQYVDLRRSGFPTIEAMRYGVTGMATAYAGTFHGQAAVRDARRALSAVGSAVGEPPPE